MASTFLSALRARDLVAQVSHEEELQEILAKGAFDEQGKRYAVYVGFDPTAKSLHVGHLIQILSLRRAQDAGLTPIILFGGATGLIGDPTGRTDMRPMNTREQINEYVDNFTKLVQQYFRTDVPNPPIFVNNIDWLGSMSWLDFSRNVAAHFTIARLLASDFSKSRLEHGLTFMEMSYQLLQAYDFLHLNRNFNCIAQVGGNDQWSNVLAGADLIRRVDGRKAFALTTSLLTSSDGRKLGKTAGNAIWIDPTLTSPYELYQYFRNCHDNDINLLFRFFTFRELAEIEKLCDQNQSNINETKQLLAYEVTELLHGKDAADAALQATKALFSGEGNLDAAPTSTLTREEVSAGIDILSLLIRCGFSTSRGEARKLIQGNGLSMNNKKLTDPTYMIQLSDFETEQKAVVLKKGKKDFHLVRCE